MPDREEMGYTTVSVLTQEMWDEWFEELTAGLSPFFREHMKKLCYPRPLNPPTLRETIDKV